MVYSFDISTPANTARNAQQITRLPIDRGVLVNWAIHFPHGSEGKLYIRLKRGFDTLLPRDELGYFKGDDYTIGGQEFVYIKYPPYVLSVHTWNLDTTHAHSCNGEIFIMPLWSLSPFSEQFTELLAADTEELVTKL